MKRALPLLLAVALAGCGGTDKSANQLYDELNLAIPETAAALNRQVENELSATERRLDQEANEQLDALNAQAAESLEANGAGNSAEAGNRQ